VCSIAVPALLYRCDTFSKCSTAVPALLYRCDTFSKCSIAVPALLYRCDTWSLTVGKESKLNVLELRYSCKVLDLRWKQQQKTEERYIKRSFAVSILIHVNLCRYRRADSTALRWLVYRLQHRELRLSPPEKQKICLYLVGRGQSISGGTQPLVQRALAVIPLWKIGLSLN